VPFLDPADMLAGEPLPGWRGRFFHSENMTFSHYDIATGAVPLHEHSHEQEEVWHVIEGTLVLTVGGEECTLGAGHAAVVPPNTPHSARALSAVRAIVADYPLRSRLPGGIGSGT
jgi:unsaturated pyranuronate lyase